MEEHANVDLASFKSKLELNSVRDNYAESLHHLVILTMTLSDTLPKTIFVATLKCCHINHGK